VSAKQSISLFAAQLAISLIADIVAAIYDCRSSRPPARLAEQRLRFQDRKGIHRLDLSRIEKKVTAKMWCFISEKMKGNEH
jgi:hypothetical protein